MRRLPRDVSVYLYKRGRDGVRFLMMRRTPNRGGFWQGVSGAPLPGETDEEAAVREVREETAYAIGNPLPLGEYSYSLRPELADRWKKLYGPGVESISVAAFAADVSSFGDPVLDPAEHDDFAWCAYEEAAELLDWPIESDAQASRRRVLASLMSQLQTD